MPFDPKILVEDAGVGPVSKTRAALSIVMMSFYFMNLIHFEKP